MRELARAASSVRSATRTGRARTLIEGSPAAPPDTTRKRRNAYDARHQHRLPGKLAMSEHKPRSADVEVNEAYDGSGATYDFYAQLFGRRSIDGKGMRLDSTVHYGTRFGNAMWNGRQMVYGDGDGRIFNRFTASLDVIGHELTHGVTQFSTALGYSGQTGALNEHLSDAFGIMVKQYKLGQSGERVGLAHRRGAVRSRRERQGRALDGRSVGDGVRRPGPRSRPRGRLNSAAAAVAHARLRPYRRRQRRRAHQARRTLPGTFAHRMFVVSGMHTTVAIRLRLKASP